MGIVQILRSLTAGKRPTGRVYGEPYVNFADNQFGVFDSGNNPRDLLGFTQFSTGASYVAGQGAINAGVPYVALVPVSPGSWNPAQWLQVIGEAPNDGNIYGRQSKAWANVSAAIAAASTRVLLSDYTETGTANGRPFDLTTGGYDGYEIEGVFATPAGSANLSLNSRVQMQGDTGYRQGADYFTSGSTAYWYASAGGIAGFGEWGSGFCAMSGTALADTPVYFRVHIPYVKGSNWPKAFFWECTSFLNTANNGVQTIHGSCFLASNTLPLISIIFYWSDGSTLIVANSRTKFYGLK